MRARRRRKGVRRADRPELTRLLRDMLREGDTLVIWKLDRLALSLKQLIETTEDLKGRRIDLVLLTDAIVVAGRNAGLSQARRNRQIQERLYLGSHSRRSRRSKAQRQERWSASTPHGKRRDGGQSLARRWVSLLERSCRTLRRLQGNAVSIPRLNRLFLGTGHQWSMKANYQHLPLSAWL